MDPVVKQLGDIQWVLPAYATMPARNDKNTLQIKLL
ncbi:MAG: hypothetical protein PG979_000412 [Rickettsia asembonensis]|nr:MAG: hypothetical protein PG979_000412 [Rickettsia asembonensis]